jgi:molybdate transport repressor ModE-like protein
MPIMKRAPAATKRRLVVRVKIWLEAGGEYAFGFGLSEMLQVIQRTGSIKHAAAEVARSYRYVWGRIKLAEEVWGDKLVETQIGGKGLQRSFLTPLACQLVADFLSVRRRVAESAELEFARHFRR